MNTSSQEEKYFDLHTTGIGYVNRIRNITPKNGPSYLNCTIAAIVGKVSKDVKPDYRYFDVRVSGSNAQNLIRGCEEVVNAEQKVLIAFRIGDIYIDTFTYTKGKNLGKTGATLKGRLLHISWMKINNNLVYTAPKQSKSEDLDSINETQIVDQSQKSEYVF